MTTGNKPCPSIRSRLTMIDSVKTLDAMVCDLLLTMIKGPLGLLLWYIASHGQK